MSRQTIRTGNVIGDREIQKVLDRLMKLEAQLKAQVGQPKQTEGTDASIRTVKKADGTTVLQVRSADGWHETGPLTFQNKE